jgi:hypothetical protein
VIHSPLRIAALSSVAFLVSAGCTSLLGDFSSDGGVTMGDGGLDASDGTSSGDTRPTGPGPDAGDAGGDTKTGDAGGDTSVGGEGGALDGGADQSAPWTPAVLDAAGELAFWLEASSANVVISNGLVGVWNDLSKNKNDAANSNSGPTLVASAIHGHDALNFASSGLALVMNDAASLQFGTDQVYIAAVARVTSGAPYFFGKFSTTVSGGGVVYSTGLIFCATAQTTSEGGSIIGPAAIVNWQAGNEVDWNSTGFEDGNVHIAAMRRASSTTIVLSVDDQPLESGQTGLFDVSEPGQGAYVGSVQFGNFHPTVNFDIAEVLAVHSSTGVVGDSDVANVHAYLKQKYGL